MPGGRCTFLSCPMLDNERMEFFEELHAALDEADGLERALE
jgi:hypothetical protein